MAPKEGKRMMTRKALLIAAVYSCLSQRRDIPKGNIDMLFNVAVRCVLKRKGKPEIEEAWESMGYMIKIE